MNRPIFLIGFMGSGKTTLGRKLANHLQRTFIDLDHLIVERVGMSIPDYFEKHGEEKFRILESEVLKEQTGSDVVVSTGGGSPCYFDNMDWILSQGIAVYLQLSPKALHARLQQSKIDKRPALQGLNGEALRLFIEEKLAQRESFYKRAHLHIDQLNTSVEMLSQSIEHYGRLD